MIGSGRVEYLKRVAEILERTGHPRRGNVLEDLETHLDEVESCADHAKNYEELVEELGLPEEYAENLVPATGYQRKPLIRCRWFWAGLISLLIVILIAIFATVERHALAAHIREMFGKNYYSTPFFDLEEFEALKPGATPQEIRDAIGYPIQRFTWSGSEAETDWDYTAFPMRQAPFYTKAKVITDSDQTKLIRKEIMRISESYPPGQEGIIHFPASVKTKTISYSRPGKKLVIKASSPELYVIIYGLRVGSAADLTDDVLRDREKFVTVGWKDISTENIRFVHIAGPKDGMTWDVLNGLLEKLPAESLIFGEMGEPHIFENRGAPTGSIVYDVAVYSRGTLFHYPPVHGSSDLIMDSYREDQHWLIHRLLQAH